MTRPPCPYSCVLNPINALFQHQKRNVIGALKRKSINQSIDQFQVPQRARVNSAYSSLHDSGAREHKKKKRLERANRQETSQRPDRYKHTMLGCVNRTKRRMKLPKQRGVKELGATLRPQHNEEGFSQTWRHRGLPQSRAFI